MGTKSFLAVSIILVLLIGSVSFDYAFADKDDDDDDNKKKKNKVLTGDGPPDKKLGKIGDGYIDNSSENCDYYLKTE